MPNYDEPEDRFADLRAQLAAATAQRDELLRAAVNVCNTSPRTSSSNERDLDHYDACTELGIAIERIARAQSGQPAHHDECACEDCLQRDDEQPEIGGGS